MPDPVNDDQDFSDLESAPADLASTMTDHDGFRLSTGMVVAAATVEVDDVGYQPALVFRFAKPDRSGELTQPVVVILSEKQMAETADLMAEAIAAALAAVDQARHL